MGFIIVTLIVLVIIASVLAQDFSVFSWAYWQEGDASTSRSEVFRNVGLFLVAVIALGFGIWRAWTAHCQAEASQRQAEAANEQARIAQQGHITERFSTAVEHLGSEQLPVRLGGIYALWRLAQDSPKRDLTSVIDILCAFVRDPPHKLAKPMGAVKRVRSDVQAVLDLLGDEPVHYRHVLPADYWLDLTGADLSGYDLRDANFSKTDFRDADLSGAELAGANLTDAGLKLANLNGAQLSGATITRANLSGAMLTDANLSDANLSDTNLTRANVTDANLSGADLTGADLTRANLMRANLTGADLTGAPLMRANLTDTNLTVANLSGAILTRANLSGADLTVTNLSGAILSDADLTDADLTDAHHLTQDQLDAACIMEGGTPPALPEGLKPPQKFCATLTR